MVNESKPGISRRGFIRNSGKLPLFRSQLGGQIQFFSESIYGKKNLKGPLILHHVRKTSINFKF